MRRMRTFLKIWTKSMKRSREWAMKSLSPFLAFLMITWVSNMTNPQKMASPMYRWAWRNWFKSLCRCKHLHLQGYLEKQLGPKEDVKETEEEEGGEAREEGATKVEVLAIWSKESCPGKAGKDGGGKHESWGHQGGVDHDRHGEEGPKTESRKEGEGHEHWQTGSTVLSIVRGHEQAKSNPCTQKREDQAAALMMLQISHTRFPTIIREGFKKKNCEKAVRLTALGGRGSHPPQPDHFYLWKFWPIFVLYKTTK